MKYKTALDKIDNVGKRRMLKLFDEMKKPDRTESRATIIPNESIQPPPVVPEDKRQSSVNQPVAWEDRDLRPGFSLGER